jgi:cytoskeletal protein CcmA (bactofilin family)
MGKEEIAVNTIIGKGASFDGLLEIAGGLRVDGTLKGKIHNADVIFVGPSGTLEADVEAKEVIVGGVVRGNIKAPDKVELQAKSQVEGDIITYSLVVEQGAIFHGNCHPRSYSSRCEAAAPQQPLLQGRHTPFASEDQGLRFVHKPLNLWIQP